MQYSPSDYHLVHDYYQHVVLPKMREKIARGEKLRVCFMVTFSANFPARSLFDAMLGSNLFAPFLLAVPIINRGKDNMIDMVRKTYSYLSQDYGEIVFNGYDEEKDCVIDLSDHSDMVYFANPYQEAVAPIFHVEHFINKEILSIHSNFGHFGIAKHERDIAGSHPYNLFWKVFVESDLTRSLLAAHQPVRGRNLVSAGFCKMDRLPKQVVRRRERKRVIVAPTHITHHEGVPACTFLRYFEFFQEMPVAYPEIDFVFRPHPFLPIELKQHSAWGARKTEEYFDRLRANRNVEYDTSPDYLDLFANSDGIIHDACSFLAGYQFTGRPTLYLLDGRPVTKTFDVLGLECLSHCYKALSEKDIRDFLDTVIIGGEDPLAAERNSFTQKALKMNHPHVGQAIADYLAKELAEDTV